MRQPNCRTTGPTLMSPQVLAALSTQVISHRSQAFAELMSGAQTRLGQVVGTRHLPVILTASGTGGLEASCVNFIGPHDRVLLLTAGYYGDLFGKIASHRTGSIDTLRAEPGACIDVERLEAALRRTAYDVVLVTHSESSTGALNPLQEIAATVRRHSSALLLVDGASSVGIADIAFDTWGLDVLVTGTQKGLMAPPGLSAVFMSDAARAKLGVKRSPSHYFDLSLALDRARVHATPFTPAVNLVFALDTALKLLLQEGMTHVLQRHAAAAGACQRILQDAGLQLFARPECRAPGITSVCVPAGVSAETAQAFLEHEEGISLSIGFDAWKSSVLRIGHMGWMTVDEVAAAARRIAGLDWDALKPLCAKAA